MPTSSNPSTFNVQHTPGFPSSGVSTCVTMLVFTGRDVLCLQGLKFTTIDHRWTLPHRMRTLRVHVHSLTRLLGAQLFVQSTTHTPSWCVLRFLPQYSRFRADIYLPACKSTNCVRLMALPVRNPIRISPTTCGDCLSRQRMGAGVVQP